MQSLYEKRRERTAEGSEMAAVVPSSDGVAKTDDISDMNTTYIQSVVGTVLDARPKRGRKRGEMTTYSNLDACHRHATRWL